jgi:hypothetical protein
MVGRKTVLIAAVDVLTGQVSAKNGRTYATANSDGHKPRGLKPVASP